MKHTTHCALRLGDNLAALHFLRKLAQLYTDRQFIHFAHVAYMRELAEVTCDLPNLKVCDLESVQDGTGDMWSMKPHARFASVDAWKNANGIWQDSLIKNDYGRFMLGFFGGLAERMGLVSPLLEPLDLMFDYPALKLWNFPRFDVLIVNSPPMSGQMPRYNPEAMEDLVGDLAKRWNCVTTHPSRHNVACTQAKHMTVSQIGALSRFCRYIVMVSTGPSWPTINTFTTETCAFRLVLNGAERLTYIPNCEHAESAEEARRVLQIRGIL